MWSKSVCKVQMPYSFRRLSQPGAEGLILAVCFSFVSVPIRKPQASENTLIPFADDSPALHPEIPAGFPVLRGL
jgi:hypothetical protein